MAITLAPGLVYHPGHLSRAEQEALLHDLRDVVSAAPLFTPRMPRTGKPFSVRMSNCGLLGWVADEKKKRGVSLSGDASPDRRPVAGDTGADPFPVA